MTSKIHIGFIEVSHAIEVKLRTRRGITGDEVRAAFEWPARPVAARWHFDKDHGRRVIALAESPAGLLKAILQPVDPNQGTWRLRTCVIASTTDKSQVKRA